MKATPPAPGCLHQAEERVVAAQTALIRAREAIEGDRAAAIRRASEILRLATLAEEEGEDDLRRLCDELETATVKRDQLLHQAAAATGVADFFAALPCNRPPGTPARSE